MSFFLENVTLTCCILAGTCNQFTNHLRSYACTYESVTELIRLLEDKAAGNDFISPENVTKFGVVT